MMQHSRGDKQISIRTEKVDEATGLPVIVNNVIIYANVSFVMDTNGVESSLRKVKTIGRLVKLQNTLNVLKFLIFLEIIRSP